MMLSTPSVSDAVSVSFATLDSRHSPIIAESEVMHGASLSGRLDRSLSGRLVGRNFGRHGIV
jgi:hypothetical protein